MSAPHLDINAGPLDISSPGSQQKFVLLNATPSPTVELKLNKCTLCPKVFISKSTLWAHKVKCHQGDQLITPRAKRKQSNPEHKRTILMKRNDVVVDRTEVDRPNKVIKKEKSDDVTTAIDATDNTKKQNYPCKSCGKVYT